MPDSLDHWQERLLSHFGTLATQRARSGLHVFALEHCLGEQDILGMASLLKDELASGKTLRRHWLPWVVYATESGYGYSGLEYWQTFEESVPYWQFDHRYAIAACFKKFQREFNGYVPTGQWAAHFKLIAWPITHAILPKDLQFEFAHTLYDARFRLASSDQLTAGSIGRLLAANAYHVSTRFEQFLQQEYLTGRIVLALFGDASTEGAGPIHPIALQRIVTDLERVHAAREWMFETRRKVTDRFKGLGHGVVFYEDDGVQEADYLPIEAIEKIRIKPSIELRYSGQGKWSALMEIPDFRPLASTSVGLRAFLSKTRCRIAGSPDPKPTGWLLAASRRSALRTWPSADASLITFEQPHAKLQQLLESECRLDRGPEWLFKVGADGTARQIHSRGVRPGHSYLLASVREIPTPSDMLRPVEIDCSGIHVYRIDVPQACSQIEIEKLKSANLQAAGTIAVWPAGILARLWNGEGNSEWLTTDAPCFGLLNDTPVDWYGVSLDKDSEVSILPAASGEPVFMGLPCLPLGKHELTVKAYRKPDRSYAEPREVAAGYLVLNVRDPEPWSPGRPLHSGLIVRLEPSDATLDELWEGQVELTILGPESRTADISIELKGNGGNTILKAQIAQSVALPISAEDWERMLEKVTSREANAWSYLDANTGELIIDGGDLGRHVTEFERDVHPLHWITRSGHGHVSIRLLDDSGADPSATRISFLSMQQPRENVELKYEDLRQGIAVAAPGGLFIAEQDDNRDIIVVSTGTTTTGLQGLGVVPHMGNTAIGIGSVAADLALYEDWLDARLAGYLATIRREMVLQTFVRDLVGITCGPDWVRAEVAFKQDPQIPAARVHLEGLVNKRIGFAAVIARDFAKASAGRVEARQWYSDVAMQFKVCSDRFLSGFAFDFMMRPNTLRNTYGIWVDRYLRELRNNKAIFRGARLAALLCAIANLPTSVQKQRTVQ